MKETELLFDLLKKGVSPVQAVRACKERLESAGFLELPYDEPWKLQKNGRYYVIIMTPHCSRLRWEKAGRRQRRHRFGWRQRIRIFRACASSRRRM